MQQWVWQERALIIGTAPLVWVQAPSALYSVGRVVKTVKNLYNMTGLVLPLLTLKTYRSQHGCIFSRRFSCTINPQIKISCWPPVFLVQVCPFFVFRQLMSRRMCSYGARKFCMGGWVKGHDKWEDQKYVFQTDLLSLLAEVELLTKLILIQNWRGQSFLLKGQLTPHPRSLVPGRVESIHTSLSMRLFNAVYIR